MSGVRVTARAKLNLGLAVGPLRPDGFHDLATVFQSVSLADTLEAKPRRAGFTLRIRHESSPQPFGPARRRARVAIRRFVPSGRENLVLRAARLFAAEARFAGGAAFRLIKRIPARAGLGGGSADAAAALLAMERLSGRRLTYERRLALAAKLGSDVPFAVRGGTALGLGRGEILTPLRLARPFRALVVVPPWRVSTAAAFYQIDRKSLALTDWAANLRSAQRLGRSPVHMEAALRLGNSFEDVLGARRKEFLALRNRLLSAGAVAAGLSGSGSAVFGILPPSVPSHVVAGRLGGFEPRYAVRSTGAGTRLEVLP